MCIDFHPQKTVTGDRLSTLSFVHTLTKHHHFVTWRFWNFAFTLPKLTGWGGFKRKAIWRTSLSILNLLVFMLSKLRCTRLAQLKPEHMRYLGELNKKVRRPIRVPVLRSSCLIYVVLNYLKNRELKWSREQNLGVGFFCRAILWSH